MHPVGVFAALTTPFGPDENVNCERLADNVAFYNHSPLAGYLVLGSSGEAICLGPSEKLAVLRCVAEHAAPGKILLAGTAEESLRGTLAMTRHAAEFGYHAAVIRTPHYYKKAMTQAAFAAFYTAVAEDAPIPVLMYNIPPLTGVDLARETILDLAGHPNVAGLKESSGNLEKLVRLAAANPRFSVLVGGAATLYPSLCAGAAGAILALAAAAPAACCAVYDAFQRGLHAQAMAAQRALLPVCSAFEPYGIAGLKAAVDAAGLHGGDPRLPQLPLPAHARSSLQAAMKSLQQAAGSAV